jgi:hypothetical protein
LHAPDFPQRSCAFAPSGDDATEVAYGCFQQAVLIFKRFKGWGEARARDFDLSSRDTEGFLGSRHCFGYSVD